MRQYTTVAVAPALLAHLRETAAQRGTTSRRLAEDAIASAVGLERAPTYATCNACEAQIQVTRAGRLRCPACGLVMFLPTFTPSWQRVSPSTRTDG
jgi:hypothetical protein